VIISLQYYAENKPTHKIMDGYPLRLQAKF